LARKFLYASDINLAQQALAANNLGRAQRLLDRHRPKPGEEDLRNWEWRYLWQQVQSDSLFVLAREPHRILGVSFSADGKFLASAGWLGSAKVWDLSKRLLYFEIPNTQASDGEGPGRAIAFSSREDLLAVASKNETNRYVALWEMK